ncbi:MAG: diiron oxygenase [Candidatus Rickettsia vulgarisii]
MTKSTPLITQYKSNFVIWDRKASIRSRPRRILEETEKLQSFFPISRQPIAIHPIIQKMGQSTISYILIQTVYKFMHDIAILETEMVNKGALIVANDHLNINFPAELRHDASSIIIDEAYHAYVAIDYINQVKQLTGVQPIEVLKKTSVINAVNFIKSKLDQALHDKFELIAVCIGEHVLTKDLISIGKDQNVGEFFQNIMADHVLDEGRHANIFAFILQYFWNWLPTQNKDILGPILLEFMREYLRLDIQQEYDKKF